MLHSKSTANHECISPGVDFINILRTAFTPAVLLRVRTQSSCQYLFTLFGSTGVKVVHRMLGKLSPGVSFINVLRAVFMLVDPKSAKKTDIFTVFFAILDLQT